MAGFSLEDAREQLKRSLLWHEESVVLEPLIGIVDGANRVFRTHSRPISNLTLYQAGGSAPYIGGYTEYDASGVIVFDTAPADTPIASYSVTEYTDAQLLDICKDGFDEMQLRYPRDYYLVSSGGKTFISAEQESVVDPKVGTLTFSTSRVQVAFLLLCCLYRLVRARRLHSAVNAMSYRESLTGGVMIDKRDQPRHLADLERDLDKQIEQAAEDAEQEASGESVLGRYLPGAQSDDYLENFEWWRNSHQKAGMVD